MGSTDESFSNTESLAMNKAWRRQSSAESAARAVTDLCDKNQKWKTGWRRLRAHSDDDFRCVVTEAAALHAHEDPVDGPWQRRQTTKTTHPRQTHHLSQSSGIRTSDVQLGALRRSAPRVRRWTTLSLYKNAQPSSYHIVSLLSRVSVVPCVLARTRVSMSSPPVPGKPDSDKLFFAVAQKKKVDTR